MIQHPEYLYHYTSIETLALILKHKTIRFSRLDLVDDPEEIKTDDFGNLGRFLFVSCWSSEEEESIPMWKMYSNDLKGVRIKLPAYPFKKHIFNSTTIKRKNRDALSDIIIENESDMCYSYIDINKLFDWKLSSAPIREELLKRVVYTNSKDLIYQKVYTESESNKSINIKDLGVYKWKYWEFQKEYRYLFFVSPWGKEDALMSTVEGHIELFNRFKWFNIPQLYIDFELDRYKMCDMVITLGPKTSESDAVIVQLLIEKFNPKARIEKSKISIR